MPNAICKRYTKRVNATIITFAIVGKSGAQNTKRYTHLAGLLISAKRRAQTPSASINAYGDIILRTKLNKNEKTHTVLKNGTRYIFGFWVL